jgi:two-component system LytT family sensor kinase
MAGGGHWTPIVASQAAFWLGWSLWAGVVVLLLRRLVERPPRGAFRSLALVALAVVPPFLVPLFYGPVHWLAFGAGHPLSFAYIHSINHDLVTNLLLSTAIAGVAYGYLGLERARRLEVRAAALGEQLTRAQLNALRAQLNPHFLFNALNSVAVLARRGSGLEVEGMVNRLAALLRHSLDSSRDQMVTLGVELEALEHYVAIERIRHGERLTVVIDVPEPLLPRLVPSFLLQPLVENAIRHGFVDGTRPLRVEVSARSEPGRLILTVADDGPGPADLGQEGIGLGNTRARLIGLYGPGASLSLEGGTGSGARAIVVIPETQG